MSDIQDEGVSSDDSERKSEDGALVWTKTDPEAARKIEGSSSHSRSQSVDSGRSTPSQSHSESSSGKSSPSGFRPSGVAVTFGITASDSLTPVDNLSGWKITWLSKTYNKVVGLTGLTRRGDFRVRSLLIRSVSSSVALTFCFAEQVPLEAHANVCLLPRRPGLRS